MAADMFCGANRKAMVPGGQRGHRLDKLVLATSLVIAAAQRRLSDVGHQTVPC